MYRLLPRIAIVPLHNYFLHFKYANFLSPPIFFFIVIQLNYINAAEYRLI